MKEEVGEGIVLRKKLVERFEREKKGRLPDSREKIGTP